MKRTNHSLLLIAALTLAASGCSKEREFKNIFKEKVDDKSIIDTQSIFLYAPSTTESPRTVSANRPHWQGDAKLVKFRFSEKSLDVVEVEPDGRFRDNATNEMPVLSIPVQHLQYRCKENAAKECANEEEENNDISWAQKTKFKPDFSGMKTKEVSFLPLEIDNLYIGCNQEIDSKMLSYNFDGSAVNFELEKTYRTNPSCAGAPDSPSNWTFDSRYHYSFIRLDSVASPNYQAVAYPQFDEGKFGYFTTESSLLSIDNRDEVKSKKVLLNRWNPARKEVVYYLSENFNKPEYARVRKATEESFAAVNNGFKAAGVDIRFRLAAPNGSIPGDLRSNMIILVEDPQAAGVIGYGPTVANPYTGEIVNGRVVMYLGTMKKYIFTTWDEMIEKKRAAAQKSKQPSLTLDGQTASQKEAAVKAAVARAKQAGSAKSLRPIFGKGDMSPQKLAQIKSFVRDYQKNARDRADKRNVKSRIEVLSKYNIRLAEHVNFEAAIERATLDELKDMEFKPWTELSDADKDRIIAAVLPYVWIPTLVHELGHNVGLRHNFAGSEDKPNFYTEQELGENHDHFHEMPQYSSIMDYPYHNLNELRLMGKYDVAAIRFGYARKVELADGQMADVPETLKALGSTVTLKDYQFCTDEHVGINAGCKRFDEGTSYKEIAAHLINAYQKNYARRNFRNERADFSLMSDLAYADAINDTMGDLRVFFEVYERLQERFNLTPEQWESIAFLKDLKEATGMALDFFIETIEMPDQMCAIANKANPSDILGVQPIKQFGDFTSCFDPKLLDNVPEQWRQNFVVVAQAGKAFNSVKHQDNENPYADQIDQRGIWIDKLLAANYLFARELGISLFDKVTGNFADTYPGAAEKISGMLDAVYNDGVARPVEFTLADGSKANFNLSYELFASHMIDKPLSRGARLAFGTGNENVPFARLLTRAFYADVKPELTNPASVALADRYKVWTFSSEQGGSTSDYKSAKIGGRMYYALPENTLALDVFAKVGASTLLAKISKDRLEEVRKAAVAKKAGTLDPAVLAAMSEDEKAAVDLDPAAITDFAAGVIKPVNYYSNLLDALATGIDQGSVREQMRQYTPFGFLVDAEGKRLDNEKEGKE